MAFVLIGLCSCTLWRHPPARRCHRLSVLPEVFSSEFRQKALRGRYSLKVSRAGQVGILRGRFLYLAPEGLWAEGHDPLGGKVLEARARGEVLELLFLRERVLYRGRLEGDTRVCLSFGQRYKGVPTSIEGEAGPWRFRLKLKDLSQEVKGDLPFLSTEGVVILPLGEFFELLWSP